MKSKVLCKTFFCRSFCFCVHHFRFFGNRTKTLQQKRPKGKRQKQRIELKERRKERTQRFCTPREAENKSFQSSRKLHINLWLWNVLFIVFDFYVYAAFVCRRVALFWAFSTRWANFVPSGFKVATQSVNWLVSWNAVECVFELFWWNLNRFSWLCKNY